MRGSGGGSDDGRAGAALRSVPAHYNCHITHEVIGAASLVPTIKYYSHFTIMPNKLLLTYKFRVFFSLLGTTEGASCFSILIMLC